MQDDFDVAPQEATEEGVTEEVSTGDPEETPEGTQEAALEAEGDEPSGDDGSEEDSEERKRKSRHQRRKEQLERARQAEEQARREVDRLRVELKRREEQSAATPAPRLEDFGGNYEEYQAALSAHHAMRMLDQREAGRYQQELTQHEQQAQQAERIRRAQIEEGWASRINEARSRYADFEQVVTGNEDLPIPTHVAEVIKQLDHGADVAYHLGTNVHEAARIAQLSPLEAAVEIGRIEATLARPSPKTITQAPDPVRPVRPKASATKDPSKMTFAQYEAWRAKGGSI